MPPEKKTSDLVAGSSGSGHAEGDSHRSISPEINAPRLSFTGPGPLTSDGARFTMDLEAFEDIEKELEAFVLFKNTGEYEKAHEMFQDVLSAHLQVFPIVAEYADLLLCQGLYRILLEFLEIQLEYMQDVLTEVEIELLLMMKSLAGIYRHGALREALSQAVRTWEFLSQGAKIFPKGTLPTDTEIHIYEIYVDIFTLAFATSDWVTLEDMKCPWISTDTRDCIEVVEWYKLLSQKNRLWEASRVLRPLLSILPKLPVRDAATLFDHHCFGQSTPSDLSDGSILDELAFVAVSISRAHALLALNLLRLPAKQDPVSECLWQAADAYHNAADILMRDSQTIPQLTWPRLQVQVQRMEFRCARGLLGFPTDNIPIIPLPHFDANEVTSAIPREFRKCYLTCLAHSKVDSLAPYLSQMHDVGDSLGCIDVYNIVCSLLRTLEDPQQGEGKPIPSSNMYDPHVILCSGHNGSASPRDREKLLKIKSRVSHLDTSDGTNLEEPTGNFGRTRGTDLPTFDVPVPIFKDWVTSLSPEAVEEIALHLQRYFDLENSEKQDSPPTIGPVLSSKIRQSDDTARLSEQFQKDKLSISVTSGAFDKVGHRRRRLSGEVTIQGQLHHAIHNLNSPLEKFVSRGSLETIWTDKRLTELIETTNCGLSEKDIPVLRREFLQTISILTYMEWNEWSAFNDIFFSHRNMHGQLDRTDACIPEYDTATLESDRFLGPITGAKFIDIQYMFCPIDIREGKSISCLREQRLPFIRSKCILGRGASGAVTKEVIPARHYLKSSSRFSSTDVVVARKASRSIQDFSRELRNLEFLRDSLTQHDSVVLYLAAIKHGNEGHILTPLANMDLEGFLAGAYGGLKDYEMSELLNEATNVADALEYLHNGLQLDKTLSCCCCHRDLKPSHILVYLNDEVGLPRVGKWKISGFGRAVIASQVEDRGFIMSESTEFRGPYHAPEEAIGRKGDIWSFGCILVRLLAFILDGVKGLQVLDALRGKGGDKLTNYDDDYFHRGNPPTLNPHIEEWIEDLPKRYSGYSHDFLLRCRDLLLSMLEVDPKRRPHARDVNFILQELLVTGIPRLPQYSEHTASSNTTTTAAPLSSGGVHHQSSSSTSSAAPGPIPATTPLVVRQDSNGVQWIAFEYSRDRVKMEYTIRCDVESVNVDILSQEFKTENCVYPRACCSKDQYRGNRLVYETECNAVGWALAELNPSLRGKRGLIQRAVDSWRNSEQDPRLRSRRVRRMAKINRRQTMPPQPPAHMTTATPVAPGVASATMAAPGPRSGLGPLSMGPPQLHHHHAQPEGSASNKEVSGMFHHV